MARCNTVTRLTVRVAHERIEENSQWEGFALDDLRSEALVAVMAAPELDSLEILVAPAFPSDAQTVAVEATLALGADKIRMNLSH